MTLGQKIRQLREKFRLKQQDLASTLQVTPQAVSKWERDENDPDLSMLIRLARLFGVSTDHLLGADEPKTGILEATVFATSLREFARKSELLDAREVAAWANGIFQPLTEAVLKYGGVPVKYVGDGFLCFFAGADHAQRALDAALFARRIIATPELIMALNTGELYLGAVGHAEYSSRDICGDAVNKAFLVMPAVTAHFPSGIGLTQGTAENLSGKKNLKKPVKVRIRQSNDELRLYEPNLSEKKRK